MLNIVNRLYILKLCLIVIIFSFFFGLTHQIFAEEKINNFDSVIKINSNSSIFVTENILYDFGSISRHGIYRDIPTAYRASDNNRSINIEVIDVKRDGLLENYTISDNGTKINIKIGKSEEIISGKHLYTISYEAQGTIGYFDKYDELYWNITGNEWQVPIDNVTATIELPKDFSIIQIQASCYIGVTGSKEQCSPTIESNKVSIKSAGLLDIGEGVTLAVGFPNGIVQKNIITKNKFDLKNMNGFLKKGYYFSAIIFLFPIIITLVVMFFIWRRYGKDPRGLSTIIPEYEPPQNMKPTLVGSLVDERVDPKDITAGIIYLAEQGYIKINRIEKKWFLGNIDYELELIKSDLEGLEKTEKAIMGLIFSNDISVGKIKKISEFKRDRYFINAMKQITKDVYQEMTDRGYFEKNPFKIRTNYAIVVSILIVIGVFILPMLVIPAIIISSFSFFMSRKTKLGAEIKDHILGFKEFLAVTEKDRLNFHNAPEKSPEEFMKYLPYAIALGVEKKWAKQFEGIYISEPVWYHSNVAGTFLAVEFASHMSGFSQSMSTNSGMSGGSGSGGGGFSGGGGGGGGGGSW